MIHGEQIHRSASLALLLLVAVSWLGCSSPIDGSSNGSSESDEVSTSSRLLASNASATSGVEDPEPPPPTGPQAVYLGGPVIERAEILAIAWTSNVTYTETLPQFYSTLTHSTYLRWLREYSTDTQRIHGGNFLGLLIDDQAPTTQVISDQDIQTELIRFLRAHQCVRTNTNSIFSIHFPAGTTVTRGTKRSCTHFCGYHSSFIEDGAPVRYTVIPDLSGCAGRCGGLSALDDTFAVSSHEVVETITDPDIALAQGLQSPVAWYDPANGEIADACSFQTDTLGGFVVQEAWSNRANACVSGFQQPGNPDAADSNEP